MIQLVRNKIKKAFCQSDSVNPSLLLQKGLLEIEEKKSKDSDNKLDNKKTDHLKKMVNLPASPEYENAFNRWFGLTDDPSRFQRSAMALENRLLIGLTGNAALETGCNLSHNYGMPYISGSSVKGIVRAWAIQHLTEHSNELEELFGTDDSEQPHRVSGLVTFHDAWWIPKQESTKPFVLDVVTTHHQKYYNGTQDTPLDTDSPIPNHLLAVQGSFLFVLEGDPEATKLCQTMMERALAKNGIGAKTAAGYGYMKIDLDWAKQYLMTMDEKLESEVRELTEKQLSEMFSKELNKTKERIDFN